MAKEEILKMGREEFFKSVKMEYRRYFEPFEEPGILDIEFHSLFKKKTNFQNQYIRMDASTLIVLVFILHSLIDAVTWLGRHLCKFMLEICRKIEFFNK